MNFPSCRKFLWLFEHLIHCNEKKWPKSYKKVWFSFFSILFPFKFGPYICSFVVERNGRSKTFDQWKKLRKYKNFRNNKLFRVSSLCRIPIGVIFKKNFSKDFTQTRTMHTYKRSKEHQQTHQEHTHTRRNRRKPKTHFANAKTVLNWVRWRVATQYLGQLGKGWNQLGVLNWSQLKQKVVLFWKVNFVVAIWR